MVECSRVKYNQTEPSRAMVSVVDSMELCRAMVECSRVKCGQVEPSRATVQCMSGVELESSIAKQMRIVRWCRRQSTVIDG